MTHMTEKLKSYFETVSAYTMAVMLCHFTWTVQKCGIVQLHYYDEQYIVYMFCIDTWKAPLPSLPYLRWTEFSDTNECFKTVIAEIKAYRQGEIGNDPEIEPDIPTSVANRVQMNIRL